MENGSRDLLVVFRLSTLSQEEMQREFQLLNKLLYGVESINTHAIVNEIIDLNKYKIITNPFKVAKAIMRKHDKPFVFIYNRN